MALITAVLFIMVTTLLAASAMTLSQHSLNTTAVDRKRTQSIGAAEAGIDMTLPAITGATPPCTAALSLGTGPTQSSYSVVVTYYNSTGTPLLCTANTPVGNPVSALVASTGTTNASIYGNRTMDAFVKLTAITSGGFGVAILANGPLQMSNQATINGNGANNANIYTNTSYTCANNQMVYGNVYSQGDITASNTCSVSGDWWAKGSVVATGNGTVGGNVYAGGATTGSAGTVSMGITSVAGSAVAKGSISPTPCGPGNRIAGTCSANGAPGAPPVQAFPVLDWNASAWTTATVANPVPFAVTDDRGKCTGSGSRLYTDLAAMATSSTPTVFLADCPVDWGKNTWTFNTDVAVWSTGGMSSANQVTFQSSSTAAHNFYMIVPYHNFGLAAPVTCPADISFTNKTTIGVSGAPLNVFVYTPCDMTINNNQTLNGQLYSGGAMTINNRYTMNFRQVTPPGGAVGSPTIGYTVALEYEREVAGP